MSYYSNKTIKELEYDYLYVSACMDGAWTEEEYAPLAEDLKEIREELDKRKSPV